MSDPHSPKFIIALCEAAAISVPHHNTTQRTSQSLNALSSPFLFLLDAIFTFSLNDAPRLSHRINEYSKEINDLAQLFSGLYIFLVTTCTHMRAHMKKIDQ